MRGKGEGGDERSLGIMKYERMTVPPLHARERALEGEVALSHSSL